MKTRTGWMMWWSGCFATATFIHLLRVMTGLPVTIGAWAVPIWISWVILALAGGISVWLVQRAMADQTGPPRQPWELGSHRPKAPGQQAQPLDLPCCSTAHAKEGHTAGTRPG